MDRADRMSTLLDPESMTALAAMNHLMPIANNEEQAWEHIETIADAIDVVVALVENNQMSDETAKAATVDYLLKMLSSPCEDVVKLSLSGLDRIVFKTEVAIYAVRIGAFDYIANLIIRTEDGQYEKLKSSDVLAFLMAPPENKYLKTSALNHKVFDEHVRMVMGNNEKAKERGLQFLWCITHNCKEAQERVISKTELFPVILQAISDADCGRNALRLLHNLSKSDNAKKRLPVKEICALVKPIMNIPDHIISKKDKAITALTVANLLENGIAVDALIVEYLRDMVYELVQASFYSSKFTLMEVISCFNTLASKEENKITLTDCKLIKTLIDTIKLKEAPEKVIGKGYTLLNVKEMAAKTLWYLAYNELTQKRMREEGGGFNELKALFSEVQEEKLKKNLKDILWIFELKDANQKMSNLKASAGGISRPLGSSSVTSSPSALNRSTGSPSPTFSPSPTPGSAPLYSLPKSASSSTISASSLSSPSVTSPSPAYKLPSSSSSTSSSSYKTPSSSSTPSPSPSYKSPSPSPAPSYKSPSPSPTPSYKPPTPSSSSSSPSHSTSSTSKPSTSSAPSYKPPTPSLSSSISSPSSAAPTPASTPVTGSTSGPSEIPELQLDETTSNAPTDSSSQKTTTKIASPITNAPKYGKAASSPTNGSATASSEKPKWMLGGSRPSATSTPTSSPTSGEAAKPKWFVSKKA